VNWVLSNWCAKRFPTWLGSTIQNRCIQTPSSDILGAWQTSALLEGMLLRVKIPLRERPNLGNDTVRYVPDCKCALAMKQRNLNTANHSMVFAH
jgi:hypothetical protein